MIYVECFLDYETIKFLGYEYLTELKHPLSKGNVLLAMKETKDSIGIIDEDPNSANKYPQLPNYPVTDTKFNLILRTNIDKASRVLIQIPGKIEDWFSQMSSDLNIDPNRYGLLDRFGKFQKRYTGEKLDKFKKFLDAISIHNSFQQFQSWIIDNNH